MNNNLPSEILAIVERLKDLNLREFINEKIIIEDWNDPMLAYGMSTNELVAYFERSLLQFEQRFKKDDAVFLPNILNYEEQQDPNQQVLTLKLTYAESAILNKDLYTLSGILRWLINYQVVFNFWNQSENKIHDVNTIEVKKIEIEINGLLQKLNSIKSELIETNKLHNDAVLALKNFQEIKDSELKTISNSLITVNNQTTEVNSIWSNATRLNSEITSILNSSKVQYEDLKNQINKQDEIFENKIIEVDNLKKKISENIEENHNQYNNFIDKLVYIESKKDFIEEKEKEIIKLTGFAADGTLGFTFNKRKDELVISSKIWLWAIPIMSILTIGWVFVIFKFLPTDSDKEWIATLINSIKTLPAILLLIFSIKQYNKERNLQEEYAFKATVAMTLKAYADQIHGEIDSDRRKMLLEAINKIYSSPKINNDNSSIFTVRTKPLSDSIKDLTDVANNLAKVIHK